jgi:UDP-N-acetyl-D-galactosamine dehydrogenase
MNLNDIKIGIIGLGYVGLPLAVEFGKHFTVTGFDINKDRVNELKNGIDRTFECTEDELKSSHNLFFSTNINSIKDCNIYIVTVPTPIDKFKSPDLKPILNASDMIGSILKKGDLVIYESTVYPGCTEEDCVPVLEKKSNLIYNSDFFCGYSPERINPGDKINTLTKIKKVTSGSNELVANFVDDLYKTIIIAGTYKATSIKVAEASKAIENAQRDLNISFINELSLIFEKLNIDTTDVLDAASTKWNFLKFKPGLVGGHCIGVDPYYLVHKAQSVGYFPEVILSGRRVNENMGYHIASRIVKLMIKKSLDINSSKILILGFSFKENCPDIRNTKVIDIYNELFEYSKNVTIYDPVISTKEVELEFNIKLKESIDLEEYDVVILAVSHDVFQNLDFENFKKKKNKILFDIKSVISKTLVDGRL